MVERPSPAGPVSDSHRLRYPSPSQPPVLFSQPHFDTQYGYKRQVYEATNLAYKNIDEGSGETPQVLWIGCAAVGIAIAALTLALGPAIRARSAAG